MEYDHTRGQKFERCKFKKNLHDTFEKERSGLHFNQAPSLHITFLALDPKESGDRLQFISQEKQPATSLKSLDKKSQLLLPNFRNKKQ